MQIGAELRGISTFSALLWGDTAFRAGPTWDHIRTYITDYRCKTSREPGRSRSWTRQPGVFPGRLMLGVLG